MSQLRSFFSQAACEVLKLTPFPGGIEWWYSAWRYNWDISNVNEGQPTGCDDGAPRGGNSPNVTENLRLVKYMLQPKQ